MTDSPVPPAPPPAATVPDAPGSTAAFVARYGTSEDVPEALGRPSGEAALNPVLDALLRHRSVRNFTGEALPEGTVERLVAAAQSAPSSSNLQLWSVIAVQDSARRARLAELVGGQRHVREAPLFLAWLADLRRPREVAVLSGESSEGVDYLDTFLMGAVDAALAAQNASTAAESLGLGTVFIGALRNRPEEVAQLLEVPPAVFPVFGMVVGHPDPARPAAVKPRLGQAAVLHRERFSPSEPLPAVVSRYDQVMQRFYASQGLAQDRWSRHSAQRLRDAASLKGRDRLRAALAALGFPLR